MSSNTKSFIAATIAGVALFAAVAVMPAAAQSTLADKALSRITGTWVDAKGRSITFEIRDYNAVFEDAVEPNVKLTGAYRQDDSGAGYVLTYGQGFKCRYNAFVPSGVDGNELVLRVVSSEDLDGKGRFKCITGELKRSR